MQGKQNNFFSFFIVISIGVIAFIGTIILIQPSPGYFVMSFDQNTVSFESIAISENIDFDFKSSLLIADTNVDEIGITYNSINIDEILQTQGQYIDSNQKYMAYSFYIKNTGSSTISVSCYMRITEVVDKMDEYVRILVIEDDQFHYVYQKPDLLDQYGNLPHYNQLPTGINFESDKIVFMRDLNNFKSGEVKSFRVIMWLEEQDPDIKYNTQIGSIKTVLAFSINHNQLTDSSIFSLSSDKNQNLWFDFITICNVNFRIRYEDDIHK